MRRSYSGLHLKMQQATPTPENLSYFPLIIEKIRKSGSYTQQPVYKREFKLVRETNNNSSQAKMLNLEGEKGLVFVEDVPQQIRIFLAGSISLAHQQSKDPEPTAIIKIILGHNNAIADLNLTYFHHGAIQNTYRGDEAYQTLIKIMQQTYENIELQVVKKSRLPKELEKEKSIFQKLESYLPTMPTLFLNLKDESNETQSCLSFDMLNEAGILIHHRLVYHPKFGLSVGILVPNEPKKSLLFDKAMPYCEQLLNSSLPQATNENTTTDSPMIITPMGSPGSKSG